MRENVVAIVEKYLGKVRKFSGESNISMICPFHKGGQESTPSFSVNVDLGVFFCFTCKASGAIPRLLTMLGLPKDQVDAECSVIKDDLEQNRLRLKWKKKASWRRSDPNRAEIILPEKLLKPYEFCPVKLTSYGFSPDWLRYMEVGFDIQNNRITYPVRDLYGNLAGVVGGAAYDGQFPKYKVYKGDWINPANGEKIQSDFGPWFGEEYPGYDFHNHSYLWNYDRVYPRLFFGREETQSLIIVEGYKACLWLLQNGYWNTVALMGSALTERQFALLHRLQVDFILFLDNDQPGVDGALKIGDKLFRTNPAVKVANYPVDSEDEQPDNLSYDELAEAINQAKSFPQFKKECRNVDGRTS